MFRITYYLLATACCFNFTDARLFTMSNMPRWRTSPGKTDDTGEPQILTDFLSNGNDAMARRVARVNRQYFLGVVSYSGYFTVNATHDSNLFFWFFPAVGTEHQYDGDRDDDDDDDDYDFKDEHGVKIENLNSTMDALQRQPPVVLWLNGGPGSSSMFGLFTENGPFFVNNDLISIRRNPYSWHTKYAMLFVDQPAGTGFSFTNADGYCDSIDRVARELHMGLRQFFQLFPWLQSNDFYITGESFAGKYIPAVANEIVAANEKATSEGYPTINLKGLALGNALSDPYNMMGYADFAYQTGLVDMHGWREMKVYQYLAQQYYPEAEAKIYWDAQLFTFLKYSNYTNMYNILAPDDEISDNYVTFMSLPHVRRALHVGKVEFAAPGLVYVNLIPDFMRSAMHWTEKLLNGGMPIMYYSGNMDFIVAYPLSENAYNHMKWDGVDDYRAAERKPFIVNGTLHGYVKKARSFIDAVLLNAGHMVPSDQPVAALALISQFIDGKL